MIAYGTWCLIGFLGFYALLKLGVVFTNTALNSVGLLNVLLSPLSEEEKLELLPKGTLSLVTSLLSAVGVLVLVGAFSFAAWYVMDMWLAFPPVNNTWAILAYSLGASVPFFLPKKQVGAYSSMAQLLHRLVLDNYFLHWKMFRREVKRNALPVRTDFVIVTGLARAGTTSMLNHLQKLQPFASLSYANMPLLLAPNTWAKLYNPKNTTEKERSHGDGIAIGLNSTEALEEYFFKAVKNDSFIADSSLHTHQIAEEEYANYLDYQALVRKGSDQKYLAKNNNFLLRYASVRALNPDFTAVIMFRHPLYHAKSLMAQHKSFTAMQDDDPFVLRYMNWLGHHEFGQGHKPFQFEQGFEGRSLNPMELNYWLHIWINYYTAAAAINDAKTLFVSYKDFCETPTAVIQQVLDTARVDVQAPVLEGHVNSRVANDEVDPELLERAQALYQKLVEKASR